jgi:hypothetical protein
MNAQRRSSWQERPITFGRVARAAESIGSGRAAQALAALVERSREIA